MYRLPSIAKDYKKFILDYITSEGFISIKSIKKDDDVYFTFYTCSDYNEYFTLPERAIVDLYNIILEFGYVGFLEMSTTAVEYFSHYNDDYISTVLEKMDEKNLLEKIEGRHLLEYIKMLCYYYRVAEYKRDISRFIKVIERNYLI